jgi:hypothetical protein
VPPFGTVLTTVLTTTMTTVELPHAVTYTTTELVTCLVTQSARAYGSGGRVIRSGSAAAARRAISQ